MKQEATKAMARAGIPDHSAGPMSLAQADRRTLAAEVEKLREEMDMVLVWVCIAAEVERVRIVCRDGSSREYAVADDPIGLIASQANRRGPMIISPRCAPDSTYADVSFTTEGA